MGRLFVLYKVPRLKFLDSSPVTAEERAEADRVGQYLVVAKPDPNEV
jgi:leucine-rich melanocyte differentiation-associated protein